MAPIRKIFTNIYPPRAILLGRQTTQKTLRSIKIIGNYDLETFWVAPTLSINFNAVAKL